MFDIEREPIHPGEILKYEFLEPLKLTQKQFAKDINEDYKLINKIINGKAPITKELAKKFSKYFNNAEEYWLDFQKNYDFRKKKQNKKVVS